MLGDVGIANVQIVFETETGQLQLIDGHLRKDEYGDQPVPVIVLDVDETEALKLLATLDPLAGMATTDAVLLKSMLDEIEFDGDCDAVLEMLEDVVGTPAGLADESETPEPDAVDSITKLGDLITLGRHRLLCGDSTLAGDVDRLIGDAKIEMMFTDPPYGVDYTGGLFHAEKPNVNHKRERLDGDKNVDLYAGFLPIAANVVDGPCYCFFAGSKGLGVYNAIKSNGFQIHALLIWNKPNATYAAMGAQYKPRFEPFLYFKPKNSTLRWTGKSTESTVWDISKEGKNEYHPTQKPVALAYRAIGNHKASTVIDFFAGSGSTFIAAEQLGRSCYGMEISPAYCDVIVQRWEKLTGEKAVREHLEKGAV